MSNASGGPPDPPGGPGRGTHAHGAGTPGRGSGSLRGLVIALAAGLAVLLVVTVAVVGSLTRAPAAGPSAGPSVGPLPSAGPSAPVGPSSPSSTPTSAPQQPLTPPSPSASTPSGSLPSSGSPAQRRQQAPKPRTGLKDNSLYRINLSTGTGTCPVKVRRPRPPLKNAALAPYLRRLVGCLVTAFRRPLARQGFRLATPEVKTYKKSIATACGRLFATSNPAYYCSGVIYWPVTSDDGREAFTVARLGYLGLVAHEFGHHIQATTGILTDYSRDYYDLKASSRYALSRRLELQAQCFEGVFLAHESRVFDLSAQDRFELRLWHSFTGDEDPPASRKPDHGSSRAQYAWLKRGLAGADLGRCNTWSAAKRSVR